MKYGITQWSFPGYGLYAVKQAALAGCEGLQLECGRQSYGYYLTSRLIRDSYKEDAKRYGIEFMSVVANDIMFISCQGNTAEQEYADSVKSIDLTIQAAIDMECSKIMLPFFHKSQIRYEDEGSFDRAVRVVRETAEKAMGYNLTVEVETTLSAKRMIRFLNEVDMPNVNNFYDSFNLYWFDELNGKEELPELIPYNGDEIHLCDGFGTLANGGPNGGRLLGEGDGEFDAQMKILGDSHFDGWLILENVYFDPNFSGMGDSIELAKRDLKIVKNAVDKYF